LAIKIEMMRCFVAVVEKGSLAEAADALGRTPSAVSMMLKQLEDHIGAPLFETARKTHLTQLGAMVHDEARRELEHFDRTLATITGYSRAELGIVRIAVTPSIATSVLPAIIRQFLNDHPNVHIDVRDMDSAAVMNALAKDRADIGLATAPRTTDFERKTLFSDRFGIICPRDHPFAVRGEPVDWPELTAETFISNGLCKLIEEEAFVEIRERSRLMVPSTTSLLALVNARVGLTILPRLALLPEYRDLAFIPLAGTTARREVHLLTQSWHGLTPVARAFVRAIHAFNFPALIDGI
jgi:DNA-binding transcriptional LysR family regulator